MSMDRASHLTRNLLFMGSLLRTKVSCTYKNTCEHFLLGITIKYVDTWLLVDSALGVKVRIGNHIIVVTVGPEHFSATRGLCGKFNGNPNDDFMDVSGKQAVRAELFATRYKFNHATL